MAMNISVKILAIRAIVKARNETPFCQVLTGSTLWYSGMTEGGVRK
jgi:hypothetical protein